MTLSKNVSILFIKKTQKLNNRNCRQFKIEFMIKFLLNYKIVFRNKKLLMYMSLHSTLLLNLKKLLKLLMKILINYKDIIYEFY